MAGHWVGHGFKNIQESVETQNHFPGGPCIDDVSHRKIWSISTGKLIDECDIDTTADSKLNREMDQVDDIRVELVLKDATRLYERKGPDINEIFSQPRLCQEVAGRSFGGTTLKPGFSLDLTMNDPATGNRGTSVFSRFNPES